MVTTNRMQAKMFIWDTDAQTNLLTQKPITRFSNITKHQTINAPESHSITCNLTDKATANIRKGAYYELYRGFGTSTGYPPSGYTLYMSGYITDIQQTETKENQFTITASSAMLKLSDFRNLNNLEMDYPTYQNMLGALNGAPNASGVSGPHHKGILTGTGWKAVWVQQDGSTPATDKIPGYGDSWYTAWETALLNVDTMAQHYNVYFRQKLGSRGSSGTIEIGPLNDPAKDPAGGTLTIWGGEPLLKVMQQNPKYASLERPNAAIAQNELHKAVIQAAQYEDNTAQILNLCWMLGKGEGASLVTLAPLFPPMFTTVKGKDIINSSDVPGSVYNYYHKYQANAGDGTREYWKVNDTYQLPHDAEAGHTRVGVVTGWDNITTDTYRLISSQNQDGTFSFGVLNETSAAKYGIRETTIVDKKTDQPALLLSEALGGISYNADPVPSWTLPVYHPMQDGVLPADVQVGQHIDVQYAGEVFDAIEMDNNGQWQGIGSYQYLRFPTTADLVSKSDDMSHLVNGLVITKPMYDRMTRVVEVVEQWANQQVISTYTMGKGPLKKRHFLDEIAQKFEKFQTAPHGVHPAAHTKTVNLDHINFIYEYGATVNVKTHVVEIPPGLGTNLYNDPGGIMVSNVQVDKFFDDNHGVQFDFQLFDDHHILDFWFAKPVDQELKNWYVDGNHAFAMFRIAMPKSGWRTGFFLQNGAPTGKAPPLPVFRGKRISKEMQTIKKAVIYTCHIKWHNGVFTAHMIEHTHRSATKISVSPSTGEATTTKIPNIVGKNRLAAVWHDNNAEITTYGAIGWHCTSATGGEKGPPAELWGIEAHALHEHSQTATHEKGSDSPRYELVNRGGTGFRTYTDTQDRLTMLAEPNGRGGYKGFLRHGPLYLDECTLSTAVTAQGTILDVSKFPGGTTIPADNGGSGYAGKTGLPPHTLLAGYVINISDPNTPDTAESVTLKSFDTNHNGWITALHTDPVKNAHGAGTTLWWDHLENQRGAEHSTFFYQDESGKHPKRTGYATIISSADQTNNSGGPKVAFIIYPDGSIGSLKAITDSSGNVLSLANLAATAASFALGLEHSGELMFDAGERYSSTQRIYAIPNGGTITPDSTVVGDDKTYALFDLEPYIGVPASGTAFDASGGSQASWVAHTSTGDTGISDEILQLTTTTTSPTIQFQDNQIVTEDLSFANINTGFASGATTAAPVVATVKFAKAVPPFSFEVGSKLDVDIDPTQEEFVIVTAVQYNNKNGIVGFTGSFTLPHVNTGGSPVSSSNPIQVGYYTRRSFHVTHDNTFNMPVFVDTPDPNSPPIVGTSPTIGDVATLAADTAVGATVIPVTAEMANYVVTNGDQWIIGHGTPNVETVTVTGSSLSNPNGFTCNATTQSHSEGDIMYMTKTAAGATVNPPANLNGGSEMDPVAIPSNVMQAIAVGYYCHFRDTPNQVYYTTAAIGKGIQTFSLAATVGGPAVVPTSLAQHMTIQVGNDTVSVSSISGTSITARFTKSQASGSQAIYYTGDVQDSYGWFRAWWGDPNWVAPYLNTSNFNNPNGGSAGPASVTGSLAPMKYMGPLNIVPQQWGNLSCKASDLGLYEPLKNQGSPLTRVRILGIELACSGPGNYTTYFDAHQSGFAGHPGAIPAKSLSAKQIADSAIHNAHKNPNSFADAHAHSDLHFWLEQWHQTGNANDGWWYVHWEHPQNKQGEIILKTGSKTDGRFPIFSGPSRQGNGPASETHPNYGVVAVPILKPSTSKGEVINNTTVTTAQIRDNGDSSSPTDLNNIKGNYLVFNSSPVGYWIYDPGVAGKKGSNGGNVWIPPYIEGSTSQQTSGIAVLTDKFNWHDRHNSDAMLKGPDTNLFPLGKLEYMQDPHSGEIGLLSHHSTSKKYSKNQRHHSITRSNNHHGVDHKHRHHGLIYFMDSTEKAGVNATHESTFHCNLMHHGSSGTIVADDGKVLATISKNYFLNKVKKNWWIVYDDGTYFRHNDTTDLLHVAGFYAFADTWSAQQAWMNTNTDASVQRFYKTNNDGTGNYYFDPDVVEAQGMYIIGKVSDNKERVTHQYYLEGKDPRSHQWIGQNIFPGSVNRRNTHKTNPNKKTRKKTASSPTPAGGGGSAANYVAKAE